MVCLFVLIFFHEEKIFLESRIKKISFKETLLSESETRVLNITICSDGNVYSVKAKLILEKSSVIYKDVLTKKTVDNIAKELVYSGLLLLPKKGDEVQEGGVWREIDIKYTNKGLKKSIKIQSGGTLFPVDIPGGKPPKNSKELSRLLNSIQDGSIPSEYGNIWAYNIFFEAFLKESLLFMNKDLKKIFIEYGK